MLISPGAQNQTSRSLIPAFGILGFWATKPLDQTVATHSKKVEVGESFRPCN